jgi:hypothetical protein
MDYAAREYFMDAVEPVVEDLRAFGISGSCPEHRALLDLVRLFDLSWRKWLAERRAGPKANRARSH